MKATENHHCQFTPSCARTRPYNLRCHHVMSTRRKSSHCSEIACQNNTGCSCRKEKTVVHKTHPRFASLRQNLNKCYAEASRLFSNTKTHITDTNASRQDLTVNVKTTNDMKMISSKSAVSFPLLLGNTERNIPSILLDTVEDTVPAIHRDS